MLRRQDSNLRPSGYEPDELTSAPLRDVWDKTMKKFLIHKIKDEVFSSLVKNNFRLLTGTALSKRPSQ